MVHVYKDCSIVPPRSKHCVLAIGNFDGVHHGHRKVLAVAREKAAELGVPVGALTFEPHPRLFFNPAQAPFRLTPEEHKITAIAEQGIDNIFVSTFDATFAALTADEFVKEILVRDLGVVHVVVGHDYRFGAKRQGDVGMLRRLGREFGFGVSEVAPFKDRTLQAYSSTRVREALGAGNLDKAASLLGRPWSVHDKVCYFGRGVVALSLGARQRLLPGLYAVEVEDLARQKTSRAFSWIPPRGLGDEDELLVSFDTDDRSERSLRVQFLEYLGQNGMLGVSQPDTAWHGAAMAWV